MIHHIQILTILICLPFALKSESIKIKTVESYIETPTGKKSYNNDHTVAFEIDTVKHTLSVKSVISERTYKMSAHPTVITRDNGQLIKFEVTDAQLTRKYSVSIPNPLVGNKISIKEIISTNKRELPATIYYTDKYTSDGTPLSYTTKYISKHFHDINETSPMVDNRCTIAFSDTAVMIGDLDGTNETKMLLVTSVEDTSSPSLGTRQKTYHCQIKDEKYLFVINYPDTEYSTPIFKLTRLVNDEPIVTTIYSGDILN